MRSLTLSTIDSDWPVEEPDYPDDAGELDDLIPWEFDNEYWDALLPDDDYEPLPDRNDFWTNDD
jgi:hypothetical protein